MYFLFFNLYSFVGCLKLTLPFTGQWDGRLSGWIERDTCRISRITVQIFHSICKIIVQRGHNKFKWPIQIGLASSTNFTFLVCKPHPINYIAAIVDTVYIKQHTRSIGLNFSVGSSLFSKHTRVFFLLLSGAIDRKKSDRKCFLWQFYWTLQRFYVWAIESWYCLFSQQTKSISSFTCICLPALANEIRPAVCVYVCMPFNKWLCKFSLAAFNVNVAAPLCVFR